MYNIAISCVGTGVGQSIISSLRLSRLPIKTVGFGTNPFGYGIYDCDAYDYTPTVYQDDYIERLIEKCKEYKIDLLIPGMDDDVLAITQNIDALRSAGIKVICADKELVTTCRDKEKMGVELNKIEDVFVKSFDKNRLIEDISSGKVQFPLIAKPRGGFASRGIVIINTRADLAKITDDHIIQELAIPQKDDPNYDFYVKGIYKNRNIQVSEISIQLVYSPNGELLGRMASYNKLNSGVPIEVVPFENEKVWAVVDRLTPTLLKLGLKGPLNIQGRLTDNGLKLFEMNPRFTGITGLRALMGFNEVEACVKEWLEIDQGSNTLTINYNRFGIRQTAEKSVPIERNHKVLSLYKKINGTVIKKKKTLFITGSCGYLGQNVINELLESRSDSFEIWAFDLDKNKTEQLFGGRVQACFDNEDLENGRVQLGNVDILLHFGFARPHCTNNKIASSLKFTNELFTRAAAHHVPAIINISSQSVYGQETEPLWNENTPVAPAMAYAQAKYASELLLQTLKTINNQLMFSSLRLGTLGGGAGGLVGIDFLSKIARQAYEGETIHILDGRQELERFDIRDAVSALLVMLESDPVKWKPIYNLGSGKIYKVMDIAEKTVELAAAYNGGIRSKIIREEKDIRMKIGMDSSLFRNDMRWEPEYDIEDTIDSVIRYFKAHV